MHDDLRGEPDSQVEAILKNHPFPAPSLEMRERILEACGTEMCEKVRRAHRQSRLWTWSLAGGAAFLLLLNSWVEHRTTDSIAQLVDAPAHSQLARKSAPAPGDSVRERTRLLAALLHDPSFP